MSLEVVWPLGKRHYVSHFVHGLPPEPDPRSPAIADGSYTRAKPIPILGPLRTFLAHAPEGVWFDVHAVRVAGFSRSTRDAVSKALTHLHAAGDLERRASHGRWGLFYEYRWRR